MGVRNGLVFNIGPHIKSDASRAATYSKRKKGLLKKVKELSILCGVDVAVMCHHPHMAGAAPLLWGQPNLDTVLSRYKGVSPEEREKRKLDNTTFLHNQVQKLAGELHHIVDHNRKLADHLETSIWDDRLNSYSAAELQQVASQVLRKKKEVADVLAAASSTTAGEISNQLMQEYSHLTGADPGGYMNTASAGFLLQHEDLVMQQLMCRMPAFRSSENAVFAAYLQSSVMNTTIPSAALCRTGPSATDEQAESENSIVSGRNGEPELEPETPVNLSNTQSMLGAVDALDDDFGPISMDAPVDMAAASWYNTGVPTTSAASDASDAYSAYSAASTAAAHAHVKMPSFTTDIFDFWTDGIGFAAPTAPALLACQATQSLHPESALLVPNVN